MKFSIYKNMKKYEKHEKEKERERERDFAIQFR